MRGILLSAIVFFAAHSMFGQQADSVSIALDTVVNNDGETKKDNGHILIDPQDLSSTKAYRAEPLRIQTFDSAQWRKVTGNEQFDEETEKEKKSWGGPSFNLPWAGPALKIGSYVVIVALVLALIYYVSKNLIASSRLQKKEMASLTYTEGDEDIEQLDLDKLLEIALRDGNFRMAVRVYYLRLLKRFNDKGLITWRKHKTNREYLQEVSGKGYGIEFRRFTLLYERIWYGPYAISDDSFHAFVKDYELVNQRLNLVTDAE